MVQVSLEKPERPHHWLRLYLLYRSAFPAAERKPFRVIVRMYRQGSADVWCVEREGKFAGLAATVNGDDLVLLDYFAVVKEFRGKGIGSAAMALLQRIYRDRGLFVEIESTREGSPNRAEKEKRKQFYLAAGMEDLHVSALVFGVPMELLGSRCGMDFEGYRSFYRDHYSQWAAKHILED